MPKKPLEITQRVYVSPRLRYAQTRYQSLCVCCLLVIGTPVFSSRSINRRAEQRLRYQRLYKRLYKRLHCDIHEALLTATYLALDYKAKLAAMISQSPARKRTGTPQDKIEPV
jgi:hypothetical protein